MIGLSLIIGKLLVAKVEFLVSQGKINIVAQRVQLFDLAFGQLRAHRGRVDKSVFAAVDVGILDWQDTGHGCPLLVGEDALPHIIERYLSGNLHLVCAEVPHEAPVQVKLHKPAVASL